MNAEDINPCRQCLMVTQRGTRCGGTGQPVFRGANVNEGLRALAVCPRHMQEFTNSLYWEARELRSPDASLITEVIVRAERARHREAKRNREASEREIQALVEARLSAPAYKPKAVAA